jgi:hypothetical protein
VTTATDLAAQIGAAGDGPLIVLAEMTFAYESGGAVANGTIYLADGVYATGPADMPASVSYIDAIEAVPGFSRSIDQRRLMGGATHSVGDLELSNPDGRLDDLLDVIVDGWPCEFYLGQPDWPRSQFVRVLSTVVERISAPAPDRLLVSLRDPGYLLDKRISGAVIGGSTSNANRHKPLVIGSPAQVEGVLGDATNLRYWLGADLEPNDVRDNGVSLVTGYASAAGTNAVITADAGTDTITIAGHGFQNEQVVTITSSGGVFAGITASTQYWVRNRTANTFQLSATRSGGLLDITGTTFAGTMIIIAKGYYFNGDGSIDLSATPSGRITADLQDPVLGGAVTLNGALQRVTMTHAGMDAWRWSGAHDSYQLNAPIGYVVNDPENVSEILDRMVSAAAAWYGFTREGLFVFGGLQGFGGDASQMTITADDLVARSAVALDRLPVAYSHVRLVYQRNWTVQTDLASSVTPANVALWASPGYVWVSTEPSGTGYSTNKTDYHASMSAPQFVDSVVSAEDAASVALFMDDIVDAHAWLHTPYNDVLRIETDLTTLGLELGDKVTLSDLPLVPASSSARVIGIDVALTARRVTLTLLYKRTPDSTTAAHYG